MRKYNTRVTHGKDVEFWIGGRRNLSSIIWDLFDRMPVDTPDRAYRLLANIADNFGW